MTKKELHGSNFNLDFGVPSIHLAFINLMEQTFKPRFQLPSNLFCSQLCALLQILETF